MPTPRWQFWIDRGGTFTDCVGRDPASGNLEITKVLSSDRAPLEGIRKLLGLGPDAPIPPCDVRMGTTLATNALLTRTGARCALVISEGFGDLLEIGDQTRPELFELDIRRPRRLYERVVEIGARGAADGRSTVPVDLVDLRKKLTGVLDAGIQSLAVALLHGHRAPKLEQEVDVVARELGFTHTSLSHEVANEIGLLGRGDTTVADAYLTPLLQNYLAELGRELPGSTVRIMQSSGGLTSTARFRGRDAILSGPAGGVVACARVADAMGHRRVIGFDMGGTSTDVSRYDGSFDRAYETVVAGVRVRTPMMAIHTVAAGGGSVCRFDGHRFVVGPESVGANPGPICYGRPGADRVALTDVNLMLGRIRPERFPLTLVETAAGRALDQIAAHAGLPDRRAAAQGFFRVAVSAMAEAIRRVTISRGHDVREYGLMVFGGAGGQHACAVARRLGVRTVLLHPHAGVLSAYGMGVAAVSWHGEHDLGGASLGEETLGQAHLALDELAKVGRNALRKDGVPDSDMKFVPQFDVRYAGTETALTVDADTAVAAVARAFTQNHTREFGYDRPGHPLELVAARLEAVGGSPALDDPPKDLGVEPGAECATPLDHAEMWAEGEVHHAPVWGREQLRPGIPVEGPALILEDTATIAVDPGWVLTLDVQGRITLRDEQPAAGPLRISTERDPVGLEIFNNRFVAISEQMGVVLRRTALSTNIRERLDFSCAVFDASGCLVANAPHIPVHLGAMSESIRAVFAQWPEPEPGDVFATNDPGAGGSHLPDITVISPVHREGRIIFYVASRGHHADVGGTTPGSMPPDSVRLADEGIVLRGVRIVHRGEFDRVNLVARLSEGPYPARRLDENLADLEAQIAANRTGARLLLGLVAHYGAPVVAAYMRHVQDNARERVSESIAAIANGTYEFTDSMDDGTPLAVAIQVTGGRMKIDFSGTGGQVDGNLNAPRAVAVAAVLYVLRTLVGQPIPLNGGCMEPVDLILPERSLLSPDPDRAVAAGNVETAQRVVDVLLGALKRAAASQGTMNNLTFGDASFGYYETIGGGAGAGPGFHGASGVHTHMTNTRITDPEILEARFPVVMHRFGFRRGSGGDGTWRGGDGLVRELEFTRLMRLSILSERRARAPFGLEGGGPGTPGQNLVGGRDLGGRVSVDVEPGVRVRIETPGGGGFGRA